MAAAAATEVNLDDLSDLAWPELLPDESQSPSGTSNSQQDILDPANLWPLDGQVKKGYFGLPLLFSSNDDVSAASLHDTRHVK